MNIKQIIINFLTFTDPQYSVALLIKVGLVVGLFLFINKFRPRWKYFGYCILLVSLVRVLLFDQYFSWGLYKDYLTADDVGWRQQSVISTEYYRFFKNTRKIEFLAVGSSQTLFVYEAYSKDHNNLILFNLAGMVPLDIYLYREYITAKNPDYVLLYLSEFDLAKEPNLNAAKIAPNQGLGLLEIFPTLSEISRQAHSEIALKEMVAGEFLPEYKYSFIFKAFKDKFMRKNDASQVKSPLEGLSPDAEQLKGSIEGMLEVMDGRWIGYNKYFLNKFLSYCRSKSLKVIIVEGQYNPLAYTAKSISLNQVVHDELESLVKGFDNVVFVPRSNVMQFTRDDYSDAVHVKPLSGYRFVENLMKDLQDKKDL